MAAWCGPSPDARADRAEDAAFVAVFVRKMQQMVQNARFAPKTDALVLASAASLR
jgi:hypothetical protein